MPRTSRTVYVVGEQRIVRTWMQVWVKSESRAAYSQCPTLPDLVESGHVIALNSWENKNVREFYNPQYYLLCCS